MDTLTRITKAGAKGKGLFAAQAIDEGDVIFTIDLSEEPSYLARVIAQMPHNDHCDYVGRGRYVISFHPYSYMNHSCEPNVVVKHETIARKRCIALRRIEKGEELTHDYGVGALDQFGRTLWTLECRCGSPRCRRKIQGDYFKQPRAVQQRYYPYLPPSVRRKHRERFEQLGLRSRSPGSR
ncbi:MAG: SET domain-containing protein-lysine N-methyltransferase [Candidatus Woesearchaeota archaeon]